MRPALNILEQFCPYTVHFISRFHKGQAVMIECKDGTRFNAILTVAGADMVSYLALCVFFGWLLLI